MLLRQSPVRQAVYDPETANFCARISREIIKAHHLYIATFPKARAVGYFTTSSTVECIYHLSPVMRYSTDQGERTACIAAFHQAQDVLSKLSAYNNVAKKALEALKGLANKWGSSPVGAHAGNNAPPSAAEGSVNSIVSTPPFFGAKRWKLRRYPILLTFES